MDIEDDYIHFVEPLDKPENLRSTNKQTVIKNDITYISSFNNKVTTQKNVFLDIINDINTTGGILSYKRNRIKRDIITPEEMYSIFGVKIHKTNKVANLEHVLEDVPLSYQDDGLYFYLVRLHTQLHDETYYKIGTTYNLGKHFKSINSRFDCGFEILPLIIARIDNLSKTVTSFHSTITHFFPEDRPLIHFAESRLYYMSYELYNIIIKFVIEQKYDYYQNIKYTIDKFNIETYG